MNIVAAAPPGTCRHGGKAVLEEPGEAVGLEPVLVGVPFAGVEHEVDGLVGGCRGQTLILLLISWSWSLQELVNSWLMRSFLFLLNIHL